MYMIYAKRVPQLCASMAALGLTPSRQLTRPCNFESDMAPMTKGLFFLFKFGVSICTLVIPAILIRYSALRAGHHKKWLLLIMHLNQKIRYNDFYSHVQSLHVNKTISFHYKTSKNCNGIHGNEIHCNAFCCALQWPYIVFAMEWKPSHGITGVYNGRRSNS